MPNCPLCLESQYPILWQDNNFRVVLVNDQNYPGYCRLEANAHVKEFSDLEDALQIQCMSLIVHIEKAIRKLLQPEKINIASLGNKTPHLHWHIIPRNKDDNHFPEPIWGPSLRNNYEDFNPNQEQSFVEKMKNLLN